MAGTSGVGSRQPAGLPACWSRAQSYAFRVATQLCAASVAQVAAVHSCAAHVDANWRPLYHAAAHTAHAAAAAATPHYAQACATFRCIVPRTAVDVSVTGIDYMAGAGQPMICFKAHEGTGSTFTMTVSTRQGLCA